MAKMTLEQHAKLPASKAHGKNAAGFKKGGSVSLPDAGYPQTGIKTSGVKTRGGGAATKGTTARGPMA